MIKYEINYCHYHRTNPIKDKIERPMGSGDYLLLHFQTEMCVLLNEEIMSIRPGGCILFTPGNPQIYWAINKFTNSYVHFSTGNDSFIADYNLPINEVFYPVNVEKIDNLFRKLFLENIEKAGRYEELEDLIMQELFIEFERQLKVGETHNGKDADLYAMFRDARLEILMHPEREWNVESMAKLTSMGTSQFYNYYHKFFRKAPKTELLEIRVERAKYLLRNEGISVNQVALQSGFSNVSHFIRYFKSTVGLSPLQYRNNSNSEIKY